MKSISIHGLDKETARLLKKRAESTGRSVNRTVKEIIETSLGLGPAKQDHRADFQELCGIWTAEEERRFHDAIKDLETVHPGEWK